MTVMVAWGVFGRYVLNDTPIWVEAGSLFLMSGSSCSAPPSCARATISASRSGW
jgi:hypothetical protein